jgi:hypothetical protein
MKTMRKKHVNKAKMCPFLKRNCLKNECEIYNEILDRCEIGVIAYNLYRLSEVERERLEDDSE